MLRVSALCLLLAGNVLSVPLFAQSSCCGQPIQGCPESCYNYMQFNPYMPYQPPPMLPPGMQPPGMQPPGIQPPGIQPPGMQPPGMQPPGMQPPFMNPIYRPPFQQQPYYQSIICNPYCQGFSGCCEWQPYGQTPYNPVGLNANCNKACSQTANTQEPDQ